MANHLYHCPTEFTPETINDQATLILGAPYLGKSHLFRESSHTAVTTLSEAVDTHTSEFVVLDEFYTAYQGATDRHRREFESWLNRDAGVCVVARPREIDWLLQSDDTQLSERFLDTFDEVVCLRYHPEDSADREHAVECCRSILEELNEQPPTDEKIDEALDTLLKTPGYEFDSAALRDRLCTEEYGATLVPALIVYFSAHIADGSGAILPDIVGDALQDVGFSEFYDEVRNACSGLFSRETLSELASIAGDAASDPGGDY